MIWSLTGELRHVDEGRIRLKAGPILYELLVPAADLAELKTSIGRELTLHTILYLEGDATRGNLEPRLIGFLRAEDRKFFDLFTTVKGIGPKTALRALAVPAAQIARAIDAKDARFLVGLDGVGRRTAELIIATLSGKVEAWAAGAARPSGPAPLRHPQFEEDAIAACTTLGDRRADAERLLDLVKQSHPNLKTAGALLREMLRLRGSSTPVDAGH
jgi:Holliday junction DNA helicase RuvA